MAAIRSENERFGVRDGGRLSKVVLCGCDKAVARVYSGSAEFALEKVKLERFGVGGRQLAEEIALRSLSFYCLEMVQSLCITLVLVVSAFAVNSVSNTG
jgi:hypothetical protein